MKKIWLFIIHRLIMKHFLKIFIGGEFSPSYDLSEQPQYIIVTNHHSHVDTLAILSSLPFNHIDKVQPVAARDYFARTKFIEFISKLFINVLLIDRKNKNGSALFEMEKALERGRSLILFPEGTRNTSKELQPFKMGVINLLKKAPHIPYIPVYITGTRNVLPKGDAMVVPHNFTVKFGKAFYLDNTVSDTDNLEKMRQNILNLA